MKEYSGEQWAEVVFIGPERAQSMLSKAHQNRPIRPWRVKLLTQIILEGDFELNGETIKADPDGRNFDGQHRLHAIIAAKRGIWTWLVHNVPHSTFDTIDDTAKRTGGDFFAIEGQKNYNILASALSWLCRSQNGRFLGSDQNTRPTARNLLRLADENPGIVNSVLSTKDVRRLMSAGIAAFCHYEFSRIDATLADEFFASLASGEHLTKTEGVYWLRERLKDNAASRINKLQSVVVIALTRIAWNAHRTGKPVKHLRWSPSWEMPQLEEPRGNNGEQPGASGVCEQKRSVPRH